jgi:hypothetical protein
MERRHFGLDSYDRFFPNQDTMPKGGFGNPVTNYMFSALSKRLRTNTTDRCRFEKVVNQRTAFGTDFEPNRWRKAILAI